jgi:ribosome-associated heat shock protein Hsp15
MRIDKLTWCLRLFKTRSIATKACNDLKVKLNGELIKASKETRVGDEVSLKHGPVWRCYKVIQIPKSRIGAKLLPEHLKETTEWNDLELLETIAKQNQQNKNQGILGRPTKKSRRDIDRFLQDFQEDSD